jgi:hypothetical protein
MQRALCWQQSANPVSTGRPPEAARRCSAGACLLSVLQRFYFHLATAIRKPVSQVLDNQVAGMCTGSETTSCFVAHQGRQLPTQSIQKPSSVLRDTMNDAYWQFHKACTK